MTSSSPRRRFLPEPVETTARSSRKPNRGDPETQLADRISDRDSTPSPTLNSRVLDQMKPQPVTAPRRFLPQLVETSSKHAEGTTVSNTEGSQQEGRRMKGSSCGGGDEDSKGSSKPRRFAPEPVETTTRTSRKFAPVPVETSTRSSRGKNSDGQDEDQSQPVRRKFTPAPVETVTKIHRRNQAETSEEGEGLRTRRKFAVAPIEITTHSNRQKQAHHTQGESPPPSTRRKFAPEPSETTVGHRRKCTEEGPKPQSSDKAWGSQTSSDGVTSPRKFSPELIETARGSFRRGDTSPRNTGLQTPLRPTAVPYYLRPPRAPSHSPSHSSQDVPQIHESRFSAACLAKKQTRQHSFIVPELPDIESDSSEENSLVPSLSNSSTASSDESVNRQHREDLREGRDGNVQGYMLSLAAQAAEKQLIDQAMAAYPNEQIHEPVHHFAGEDSDEESSSGKLEVDNGTDPKTFRRESGADLDWHMREMRRHHEQLEEATRALKEDTAGQSRFSAATLSVRHKTHAKQVGGGNQKGVGLTEMRNAASPPMLGDDLVFPMSVSPKMTRCDVDQVPVPRTHEDNDGEETIGEAKLWNPHMCVQNSADSGLWMGFCHKKDCDEPSPPTPLRSGLMTPADEPAGAQGLQHGRKSEKLGDNWLPMLPTSCIPHTDTFTASIDKKLNQQLSLEEQIEKEFNDGFVTQIYNYLSLGYPSLAHSFDHELSKISRISVEELRKDDNLADAKGYVGAPEGKGLDEDSVKNGRCVRWTALKLYIHEWARQQPDMADRKPDEWGVRARRGSWAI